MPAASHSVAGTSTSASPNGATVTRDTQQQDEEGSQDEEHMPESSLIYTLPKTIVIAKNRHVWSTKPPRPRKRKRDPANYTPGPTSVTDGVIEADAIFSLFWDDLTVSKIVYFTNEFMDKVKQKFKNLRKMYDHTSTMEM